MFRHGGQRYELTGRGKILVTVLVIILILVVISIIYCAVVAEREFVSDGLQQGTGMSDNIDDLASSEPIEGAASDSTTALTSEDNGDSEALDLYSDDSVALDIDSGTLAFYFVPDSQTALDDHIVLMIGEFLTSPINTDGAKITVEIPQLPDDVTAILTSAIIEALEMYEVPLGDIVFHVFHADPSAVEFEIKMALIRWE